MYIIDQFQVVTQEQTLKQNELTYHCTVEGCTFHFFTHAALKKHVENVHQALAFLCHYCQKRYKHQSTLKEHLNTHKEHKGFLCDICGRGFKTKDLCTSPSHVFTNSSITNLQFLSAMSLPRTSKDLKFSFHPSPLTQNLDKSINPFQIQIT